MAELFGLTTVDQRVREQGSEAARLLLEVLSDPSLDSHVNVEEEVEWKVNLLVRSSTARPAVGAR